MSVEVRPKRLSVTQIQSRKGAGKLVCLTAYTAPMNGAKLVWPGARLDGASLCELFNAEGVTLSLGVPTVWLGMEAYMRETGATCPTLRGVLSGGVATWNTALDAAFAFKTLLAPGSGFSSTV